MFTAILYPNGSSQLSFRRFFGYIFVWLVREKTDVGLSIPIFLGEDDVHLGDVPCGFCDLVDTPWVVHWESCVCFFVLVIYQLP